MLNVHHIQNIFKISVNFGPPVERNFGPQLNTDTRDLKNKWLIWDIIWRNHTRLHSRYIHFYIVFILTLFGLFNLLFIHCVFSILL